MQSSSKQTSCIQSKIIKELEEAPTVGPFEWTEFRVEVLKKYYQTKGANAIAKALGTTRNVVYRQADILGLTRRRR